VDRSDPQLGSSFVIHVRENEPLAPRTTLQLGGAARSFTEVRSDDDLRDALALARDRRWRVGILGGGSNLVVPDEGFDGLVIAMAMRGIDETTSGDRVRLTARAGEPWDPFVAHAIDRDLAGLECLGGIPGLVGATPIQNVGAYGQEVSSTIVEVRAFDRADGAFVTLGARACAFAYRDSRFKRAPDAFVVTDVTFELVRGGAPTIAYAELAKAIGERPTLREVRDTVVALRRKKAMVVDPGDPNTRSAGSFFTNPIVDGATHADVVARAAGLGAGDVPAFPQEDGRIKLAAGWLIERAGISKGLRRGNVGISDRHALALVNAGGGTTRELLALADEVVLRVKQVWGVMLEREPVLFA
jgi:UDP-N-acetylmuramate dehydrogenase